MQFANPAGIQAHVHAGDVLGNRKFPHRNLAGPAAGLQPHMGVGERKPQIGQGTVIGGGWNEQIGVLAVAPEVARTRVGAAVSGPPGLRYRVTALRDGG
jgi:hypothetical protein